MGSPTDGVYWAISEQLRLAYLKVDRLRAERVEHLERIRDLEEECEANRRLISVLAASVAGAVV